MHLLPKTFKITLIMEEKEIEIAQENAEIPDKSQVFSERKKPNEKRNTIIIGSIAFALVAALTATIIAGTVGDDSQNKTPVLSFDWTTNRAGFYDGNGKFMSVGVYDIKILKDSAGLDYADLRSVKAPAHAKEYVFPINVYQDIGTDKKVFDFRTAGNDSSTSVFQDGSGLEIEAIYTQSLYKEIKPYAFAGLPVLKKISFMNVSQGQMTLGAHLFSGDALLTTVELPRQLKSIGDFAFEGCNALETITLPKNMTSIGEAIFKDTGIREILFEGSEFEWSRIKKHASWDEGIANYEIRFLKK